MLTRKTAQMALPLLLAVAGCGRMPGSMDEQSGSELGGAIDMALTVAGLEVRSVHLEVVSSDGAIRRVRDLNVSDRNATISALESGLLAGSYGINLSAKPAVDDPATAQDETKVECAGGITGVQVVVGQTTDVNDLVLRCTLDGGKVLLTGGIRVRATTQISSTNSCTAALIQDAFVGALATTVGTSVSLKAAAVSGAALAWTASAGSVAAPSSADTTFTCPAQAGVATVTLTATSGACSETAAVMVDCVGTGQPVCGNGIVEASETCDDNNTVTETCSYGTASCQVCGAACQSVAAVGAYCGDGVRNGSEACDGGANCTAQCTLSVPNPVCGNGIVEASETCDDNNAVTETCSYGTASCQVCSAACQTVAAVGAYCGDGVRNGSEACDGGAGCTAQCTVVMQPTAVCGNNVVEAGEACDDGNTVAETCSYGTASCQVCGAACQNVAAIGAYCGDGVVNGLEACDGGAQCTAQCTAVVAPPTTVADTCEVCLAQVADLDLRAANRDLCNTDPLCVSVKRCMLNDTHDPVVAGRSCFNNIPATCYCGITTEFGACATSSTFVPVGPCAAEILAGLPAGTPPQVFSNLTSFDYPAGKAYQIVDAARQVCGQACGFTRTN